MYPYEQQYHWQYDDSWNDDSWYYGNWSEGDAHAAQWSDDAQNAPDSSPTGVDASADDNALQEALQAEHAAEAMFNEARRTWSQAQQATATLKRDRGFGQVSTAGKGKGKCFQCGGDDFARDCPDRMHPGARKGFGKQLSPAELESFLFKGKGRGKGKSKGLHAVS